MKSFCLIGDSIDQSLSPYIHSWIYNFLDIDAQYKKKHIKPKNFNIKILDLLYSIKMDLIHGVNITSPYKVNIISPDIKLSDDAKKIGAVNCIYKKNNNLIGENTDWSGFLKSIRYNKIDCKKYNINIIGSGGASKAIIYSLQKIGIRSFSIYNRTKKSILVNNIQYDTLSLNQLGSDNSKNILLINCIKSDIIDKILLSKNLDSIKVFYDLNYHQSNFHKILDEKDIKVFLGLDMLIYQAIKSIEIWLGGESFDQIDIEKIKHNLKEQSIC